MPAGSSHDLYNNLQDVITNVFIISLWKCEPFHLECVGVSYLGYYNEHIKYFSMTRNKSLLCFFFVWDSWSVLVECFQVRW